LVAKHTKRTGKGHPKLSQKVDQSNANKSTAKVADKLNTNRQEAPTPAGLSIALNWLVINPKVDIDRYPTLRI